MFRKLLDLIQHKNQHEELTSTNTTVFYDDAEQPDAYSDPDLSSGGSPEHYATDHGWPGS